tara:strand:- start:478 stop:648 length:171 start_codon:yes stop_codon:yes gene_type:complete
MTKTLQQMSMAELKEEMVRLYDGNAGEIFYGLMEMRLSKAAIKKALIRYIERKQNG